MVSCIIAYSNIGEAWGEVQLEVGVTGGIVPCFSKPGPLQGVDSGRLISRLEH
ncbi:hypothetical protein [Bartonella sp. CL43QHWL]|uniref:hypothetical protein n=1 Tax=Bartonella sp. CL43QHWL TaxID=3243532 RepID=UPI0035CEF20A